MYRACELKDQTYKKTRTLHFSENLHKSAVFCEICVLGSVCHLRPVPLERALILKVSSASSKPTTEFAQPCLSRAQGRSSPARGYKFGCVCSYMAGVSHTYVMAGHIGINTPKFVPSRWGWPPWDPTQSEVSKRGWRTEGVGASLYQRFRHRFCIFPIPSREGGHNSGEQFLLHLGPVSRQPHPANPFSKPLTQTGLCKFGGGFGARWFHHFIQLGVIIEGPFRGRNKPLQATLGHIKPLQATLGHIKPL